MKTKFMVILFLSALLLMGFSLSAQMEHTKEKEDKGHDEVSDYAVKNFKNLPATLLKALNVTADEASRLTRGDKLRVYIVSIDALKNFAAGSKAQKALELTDEVVYPLYASGQLKTCVALRKEGPGYRTTSMGGEEINYLETARVAHSKSSGVKSSAYYIVRVPVAYMTFLGYDKGSDVYLVPVIADAEMQFDVGKELSAGDVFAKLKPIAESYQPLIKK